MSHSYKYRIETLCAYELHERQRLSDEYTTYLDYLRLRRLPLDALDVLDLLQAKLRQQVLVAYLDDLHGLLYG
ncbi:MAG: hypothetical protein LBN05_02910 [Oscillospiraceae bacterium]|jgi:hypothetical protein|nr:hypothetical protein [Oscillospiraceae bacterium]